MTRVEDTRAGARAAAWHLVTSEYPPQTGGVSDYTRLVAEGLAAAGDEVHVWCPSLKADEVGTDEVRAGETRTFEVEDADENENENEKKGGSVGAGSSRGRGVNVHRELGDFSPSDLLRAGRLLDGHDAPRRLLVQYVPHGYGWRSMNIAFCLWLWKRAALGGDAVEIVVHEPFLAFGEGTWRQSAVAAVHRLLTTILLRAPVRVWATIPAWVDLWRPYALGRRVEFAWLPVPSTVPVVADASFVAARRARYAQPGGALIGHFGTYPREVAGRLANLLPSLLSRDASVSALLIGRGGEAVRDELARQHPSLGARLHAAGVLP
nr:hypothetical protein [Acidobacteriota bacterium]